MAFSLPELIIEATIREKLEYLKNNSDLIDNIFSSLTSDYVLAKYGQKELESIKKFITTKQIGVVHSFNETNAKDLSISIHLGSENENQALAHLDDFEKDQQITMTDPEALASLINVSNVTIDSYDSIHGLVYVPDSVNLANVYPNKIFVDSDGTEHTILSPVINTNGSKVFGVAAGSIVQTSGSGTIKSSLNFNQYEVMGIVTDVNLLLGVHAKNALQAKYLYILLKYLILSSKQDLINRNFLVTSFQGSDFGRNEQFRGDHSFTRFLTITGKVEDSWRSDEVIPIDNVQVIVNVSRGARLDQDADTETPLGATTEDLDKESETIQISDD